MLCRNSVGRQYLGLEVLESTLEELVSLEPVTAEVWQAVAKHVKLLPTELRRKVATGCRVSLAYLDNRVFSTLCGLPWSFQNLEQLLQEPDPPSEVTARKIWSLGRNGYDR